MCRPQAADLGHTALFGALRSGWTLHLLTREHASDPDAFAAHMASAADIDLAEDHTQLSRGIAIGRPSSRRAAPALPCARRRSNERTLAARVCAR